MAGELVDIIRRDLREVVQSEVRRFLDKYKDCEVVDSICTGLGYVTVKRDVVVDGLPCAVKRSFVLSYHLINEVLEFDCHVELEDDKLACIKVLRVADKCFVEVFIDEERIKEIARNIARKMVRDAERESGGGV